MIGDGGGSGSGSGDDGTSSEDDREEARQPDEWGAMAESDVMPPGILAPDLELVTNAWRTLGRGRSNTGSLAATAGGVYLEPAPVVLSSWLPLPMPEPPVAARGGSSGRRGAESSGGSAAAGTGAGVGMGAGATAGPAPTPTAAAPSAAQRAKRRKMYLLLVAVFLGFGFSLFIISTASKRFLPQSDVVESLSCPTDATGFRTPSLALYLLASMMDPVYLLASGRGISLILLLCLIVYHRRRRARRAVAPTAALPPPPPPSAVSTPAPGAPTPQPASSDGGSSGDDTAPPLPPPPPPSLPPRAPAFISDAFSARLLVPMGIGVMSCLAYMFYMALTSLNGVSIWSAMIACYVVLPATYGMVVRHESRGPKKLIGIFATVAGAVALGLASALSGDEPSSAPADSGSGMPAPGTRFAMDAPFGVKLGLYIGSLACFAMSDGLSAFLQAPRKPGDAPPLGLSTIVACTALGLFICAAGIAGISSLLHATIRKPSGCIDISPTPSTPTVLSGYGIMFGAQLLGQLAWFGVVILGGMGEASSFLPLTGLAGFVPSLLGVLLLGERIGAIGYAGLATAVMGALLIAIGS